MPTINSAVFHWFPNILFDSRCLNIYAIITVFSVNLVKFSIKLGVPICAGICILGGVGLIVYESMLAWGISYICLGSSIIFFFFTAKFSRHSGLQAASSVVALSLLIASVVAGLIAI